MSFPKAKLQRFNDVREPMPSPADYSPQVRNRNNGLQFAQSERFQEQVRDSSNSDSFSVRSANSSGCFRTPTLPKKKKVKNLQDSSQGDQTLFQTSLDVEAFQEKIVECNNKDLFISELSEQIEEMKVQINNLLNKNEILVAEKSERQGKTEQLLKEYHRHLENILLEVKSGDVTEEKVEFKSIDDLDYLLKKIIKVLRQQLNKKNNQLKDVATSVSALKKSFSLEAKELKMQHYNDLKILEADLLKIITHLKELESTMTSRISQLQLQFTYEKAELLDNYEKQLKQVVENFKEETKEKCNNLDLSWQMRLEQQQKESNDILKECQAISEYNIIQCEVEKNTVKRELSQVNEELESAKRKVEETTRLKHQSDSNYQNIKIEYDKVLGELNLLHTQLKQEEQNLQQAETDKRMYEVTINKTSETIAALKKRLFESDKDVEQLKLELENVERSKLKLEANCNCLSEEIESMKSANEELELQAESTLKITEEKIKLIESDLLKKMDLYRETTEESIRKMNEKLSRKTSELQEAMKQLHCQQEINSQSKILIEKARDQIECLEAANKDLKLSQAKSQEECQEKEKLLADFDKQLEINRSLQLQNEHLQLQSVDSTLVKQIKELQEKSDSYYKNCEYYKEKVDDCKNEIKRLNVANKMYIDQSEELAALKQKYQEVLAKNSELEKKVAEQESLIGPFRAQLEAYELEYRELMDRKCNAEAEAKVMGLKYAELMGHHNQKQKIKHVIDLKMKNNTLYETNMQLQQKIRAQAKIIEKLKKNSNGGKENKANTTVNYNFTSSPLRERN